MKKLLCWLLLFGLLLGSSQALASSPAFADDYEGIDQAAKSVLMLLVYSAGEKDYSATGSGFVAFDSQTLITNYHVVEDGDLVLAESDDGESFFLDQVIAADKEKDLAILRFKAPTHLSPLALFTGERLLRGQPVVAIGSPEGYKNTVSKGDISSFSMEDEVNFIHFTAPISHGSSGGALFNNEGEVIGITSSSLFGSTQNMNFAIDIKEAISLYESAKGTEASALSSLREVNDQVAEKGGEDQPDRDPVHVSDLKASQTAPGQVEVTWQSQDSAEKWFIGYEIESNGFYSYKEVDEKKGTLVDLVPGQTYTIYVSTTLFDLDRAALKVEVTLSDPLPFNQRGVLLLDSGVQWADKDKEFDVPLKPGLDQVTTGQLYQALADKRLYYVYRLKLEAAEEKIEGSCLYVLTLPSGKVYKQEHIFEYGTDRNSYLRYADLKEMLDFILEYDEGFELGVWEAAVYHDGALLSKAAFEVVEDAQGTLEKESGKGNGKGLVISAVKGKAYLNWAGLEQADTYDIYRSNTQEGHYFFVDSTNLRHYLDEQVFRNRGYYYSVSYKNAQGEKVTTPAVYIQIPSRSDETAQEQEQAQESPALPLAIGGEAYVGTRDNPYLDPDLRNNSDQQTITGFTLAYLAADSDYKFLNFADTGKLITYFDFDMQLKPGELISPGRVSMKSYGPMTAAIYTAVSSVTLQDGSVIKVPEEDLKFYNWLLSD